MADVMPRGGGTKLATIKAGRHDCAGSTISAPGNGSGAAVMDSQLVEIRLITLVAFDGAGNETKSEPVRFFVMHKPKDAAQPEMSQAMPNILITNDDGHRRCRPSRRWSRRSRPSAAWSKLFVPDHNWSAAGHADDALPLRARRSCPDGTPCASPARRPIASGWRCRRRAAAGSDRLRHQPGLEHQGMT